MRRTAALAAAILTLGLAGIAPAVSGAVGPIELNIGSIAPENSPWSDMLHKIEAQIEADSHGQIQVNVRPAGMMAEVELVREVRDGSRLQGCGVTTAALAQGGNVPILQLVELPYLFENTSEADYLLDNVLFKPFSEALGRRGFVLGMWSENGWRSFGTKGRPIHKPEDLKGLKMRSQESNVHMAMYAAFGATAVQKPMNEVQTALQSGAIDGIDTTALYTLAAGLADPLDDFTLTRHIYQPAAIVFSKAWFDKLSPDLQDVVRAPRTHTFEGRRVIRSEEAGVLAMFPNMGLNVIELTPEERDAFRAKGRAMHGPFVAGIEGGPEIYAKINTALKSLRGQ